MIGGEAPIRNGFSRWLLHVTVLAQPSSLGENVAFAGVASLVTMALSARSGHARSKSIWLRMGEDGAATKKTTNNASERMVEKSCMSPAMAKVWVA